MIVCIISNVAGFVIVALVAMKKTVNTSVEIFILLFPSVFDVQYIMLKKIAYHNLKRACLTRFISGGRSQKRPIFCGINGQNIATPTMYGRSSNMWSITPVIIPRAMNLALVLCKPRISPNTINAIAKNMLLVAVL